jgi:hypothetical protein
LHSEIVLAALSGVESGTKMKAIMGMMRIIETTVNQAKRKAKRKATVLRHDWCLVTMVPFFTESRL